MTERTRTLLSRFHRAYARAGFDRLLALAIEHESAGHPQVEVRERNGWHVVIVYHPADPMSENILGWCDATWWARDTGPAVSLIKVTPPDGD